jgi:predicted SnoaL-like aldol condensation-catalyzing enzyme
MPEIQRVVIFDIGGPQSYRTIYMDGRQHPKGEDLVPSYYGHSTGRWDGETLVVDTVGFNERTWIEAEGMAHTDRLHLIERFTRTDYNTLKYEVTVDDPGAYTATWSGGFFLRWNEGAEMFEYVCQDNNRNQETVVGADDAPPRTSRIAP